MVLDRVNASGISAYQNTANSYLKASENAEKLNLTDEQVVGKAESRYNADGTLKDERKTSGAVVAENKDGESFSFSKSGTAAKEHLKNKHDGFEKDCPDCQCETCRNRRYKDDSNDSAVSFQSASTMSPAQASYRVRGHEMEHVRRERIKADNEGKRVVSQTVRILTDTCEECGKIYVSGGLTKTVTRMDMTDFHDMFMLGFDGSDTKIG